MAVAAGSVDREGSRDPGKANLHPQDHGPQESHGG